MSRPERVRQVLRNLLANALRYTRLAALCTQCCASDNTGWLRVAVRDTGAGIAAADLPHVFR
ncbi:MAG: ATP-binding protein [Kouleothrix sp.]